MQDLTTPFLTDALGHQRYQGSVVPGSTAPRPGDRHKDGHNLWDAHRFGSKRKLKDHRGTGPFLSHAAMGTEI